MVAYQEEKDGAYEVGEEVMEMVHTDSSINMEHHSIMVLILMILEDIFSIMTCTALEWIEYHMCTVKDQMEVVVKIVEVVVVLIMVEKGTIIMNTGFSR